MFISRLGIASLISAGVLAFAVLIHQSWPLKMAALGALGVSALLIGYSLKTSSLPEILGLAQPGPGTFIYILAGGILGFALGLFTRLHFKLAMLPAIFTGVALIASLTGAAEELLFRGYLQGYLNPLNRFFALIFAALAHTAYKLLVIYSLGRPSEFDFLFLAQWTLLGGLAFGCLRLFSKSTYPPLLAHVVFDILVYGGSGSLPFWVWT